MLRVGCLTESRQAKPPVRLLQQKVQHPALSLDLGLKQGDQVVLVDVMNKNLRGSELLLE